MKVGDDPHSAKRLASVNKVKPYARNMLINMVPLLIPVPGHCGIQGDLDDDHLASLGRPNQDIALAPLTKRNVRQILRDSCRLTGRNKRFDVLAKKSIDYSVDLNKDSPSASTLLGAHDTLLQLMRLEVAHTKYF